ncbi:hypothetical protein V1498_10285 [Peribacillus sp. SCS-26]|uniref:hypothetical protein n=1 Tax=Paraperibacillus marinus TaxID=3115295 RepID=UPI003906B00E
MKKAVILSIFAFVITVLVTNIYLKGPSTVKAAVSEQITKEDVRHDSVKYRIVSVPHSLYTLVIFDIPHKIWLFKKQTFFNKTRYELETSFQTYESTLNKEIQGYVNGKLAYGLVQIPEGKTAHIKGGKLDVFPIGEYFSESKYARDYKELYFYYLKQRIKVEDDYNPIDIE